MRVLVIENSREIVQSIAVALQLRWPQAELISVAEGMKGIDVVETESPDIIILDLDLPGTDAFEVLSLIRLFSNVPTIVLTNGDDDRRLMVKALEKGANGSISKPFRPIELLASMKAMLRHAGKSGLKDSPHSIFARYMPPIGDVQVKDSLRS